MTSARDHARALDALAPALASAVDSWMRRFVARELREATRDPHAYARRVTKAMGDEDELRRLMLRFGVRRAIDTARASAGADEPFPGTIEADALAGKPVKIKVFQELIDGVEEDARRISREARETIRGVVRDTIGADPTVGVGEIARRINRTIVAVAPKDGADKDRVYVFSPARAELIARTELVQVENTARIAGYEETGIEAIEWIAYSDGRSGERHHERMDGKRVRIGEQFVTPKGNRLRFPGDPRAPIEETANCRCTTRPVIPRKPRR